MSVLKAKGLLRPNNMRARRYTASGYRAQSVHFPLKRTLFVLGAIFAALLIPLKLMLDIRTNTELAEWWTTHIQAGWEKAVGVLTSWLPFSVLEFFIVIGILFGMFMFVRLVINLCKARFYRIAVGLASILVGVGYLLNLYIMSMGFGYYRKAMPIPQAGENYTAAQAKEAIEYFLADYNELANGLKRDENGCVECPYTFSELAELMKKEYARLDNSYYAAYTPTAKPIVNSWFLSDMVITGITFLPFGESGVNTEAPPTTVTLTMAHELAHAKGVQREGDANLLARYVLLSSNNGYLRYCGYYYAFNNLLEALLLTSDYESYNKLGTSISPFVSIERKFASDFWNSQPDYIGQISEFFNNWYLQSNGAANGTGSYDDGNKSEVVLPPPDPITGELPKDPDTGEIIMEIHFSQVQKMFFWIYENKTV